jgi:glucan phosphoethanolaminetransferase (alkaline phosphatase superfamily)
MKELIAEVKTYKRPTVIFYMSDHGEGLGENGVWGHGQLKQESLDIPIILYSHKYNQDLLNQLPVVPTHFNLSLLMSKMMGFDFNFTPGQQFEEYEVLGNDIDGFAGRVKLIYKNDKMIIDETIDL